VGRSPLPINAGPCSVTIRDPNHTMVRRVERPRNNGVVALKRATLFAAAPGMAKHCKSVYSLCANWSAQPPGSPELIAPIAP